MTHKPPISYKGKRVIEDQPGHVIVNFLEDNKDVLIKLKHFHYEVMLKLIHDTPRKALEYARSSGVVVDLELQKHYIINIDDSIKIEDTQKSDN